MASLVKRRDHYYAQFFDTDRYPKRKRISLRTKRKDVARRQLTSWEEDYDRGKFDPWIDDPWSYDEDPLEALTVGDAVERFLKTKKATGRSENTLRTYREILRLLLRELDPTKKAASLSPAPLISLVWDSDLAEATMYKRYGHLRTFFRWCTDQNIIEKSPLEAVTKPQKPSKLPKAITPDELDALCTALRREYNRLRDKNWIREGQQVWRIPLFWFAFYTGMRGSELARLRWGDIDFERRLIYIREQKNQKEQTIPLNGRARAILRDLEPDTTQNDTFVFTSPSFEGDDRSARNFRERAADTFRKARRLTNEEEDLPTVPDHLSFHSLRHGFCTALAEAGKSAAVIKEAARHADIQTSMRYVHMANETLKTEIEDAFGSGK